MNRKILFYPGVFLIIFFLVWISADTAKADDVFEENDSFSAAADISLGSYSSLDCQDDDPDFYSVTLLKQGFYKIVIHFTHALGDLNLYIYNSSMNLIGKVDSTTDNESVGIENFGKDITTIFIEVRASGVGTSNQYDMNIADITEWKQTGLLNQERQEHTTTLLPDGRILAVGGMREDILSSCELYDPKTGVWCLTGSLNQGRNHHTATLLSDGRVLVVGGNEPSGPLSSCELYDSRTGTWSLAGSLNQARSHHTATLLPDGRVLIVGGGGEPNFLSSCEVYDPKTNSWHLTGSLNYGRLDHTATLLSNGELLVAGSVPGNLTSCELFNPETETWSVTGNLNQGRINHTTTLLPDGRVLASGGRNPSVLNSCELYDPDNGTWRITESLNQERSHHTATLLTDGRVLVTGGTGAGVLSGCALFDPVTGTWSDTGDLHLTRYDHTATLMPDGRVLLAGGTTDSGAVLNSCIVFSQAMAKWSLSGSLNQRRHFHTATLLPDGQVLVAGGIGSDAGVLTSCELYNPATGIWSTTGSLSQERYGHTATLLPTGKVLVTAGANTGMLATCELYDPATATWTTTGSLNQSRLDHSATLLHNGKVLVAGGCDYYYTYSNCELYDPATGIWSATGNLNRERYLHTASLLPDGKVLVAGGSKLLGNNYIDIHDSCELYNPATGIWTVTDRLDIERYAHSAVTLHNGNILLAGGANLSGDIFKCELYNPNTNTWTDTEPLYRNRWWHTAGLLLDGSVLFAGGIYASALESCERYDPATRTWAETGPLNQARSDHTATILLNGRVLLAGGYNGGSLTSSELYNQSLNFDENRQPVLISISSPLFIDKKLILHGTGFFDVSEASGGKGCQNSSTNYPLVQLRHIDSGLTRWLSYDPATPVTDSDIITEPVTDFPDGHALVTVFTNGIPSESKVLLVNELPSVVSIIREDADPSCSPSINFKVTFSEDVTGVNADDFSVVETGTISGGIVSAVTAINPAIYRVTVSGFSGDEGTVRLDVVDDDTIQDGLAFTLGGTGQNNGNYQEGEAYSIDMYPPSLLLVNVLATGLDVELTFSETMGAGVLMPANYTISGDGLHTAGHGTLCANPNQVTHITGNTYRLTWNPGPDYARNEMRNGFNVMIKATGMTDVVGNPIGPQNNAVHFNGGIGVGPVTAADPEGTVYTSTQSVTLNCDDGINGSGCAFTYYTTDGSTPTISSPVYGDHITIVQDTTLKFFSVDQAGNAGVVQNETYSIDIPSQISCMLSTGSTSLGGQLQVFGKITPIPAGTAPGLGVKLTPPIGSPILFSVNGHIEGNFSTSIPCELIDTAGIWRIQTLWEGDSSHSGASSTTQPLTVFPAKTTLTLDILTGEAIKLNSRPPIGGKLSTTPTCSSADLSGLAVILNITDPLGGPDNTTQYIATTNANGQYVLDYDTSGFAFNKIGQWSIQAKFAATNEYEKVIIDPVTVDVVPTAGYAVIIQGKSANGEGLAEHSKTASFIHDTLNDRQLLNTDIEYLGWNVLDAKWDDFPFKSTIQETLTSTVRDKMIADPGNLYIVMIDHGWTQGENGIFYVDPDAPLTSAELAEWLNTLQDSLAGTAAQDRKIIVILGFCRAGAFIKDLTGDNRIIIASAAEDEYSHRGPKDVDEQGIPLRDGEYCVTEFFKQVANGKSVKECFEQAASLTETFTASGKGLLNAPYFDDSLQHPLMDSNGDGIGSNELTGQPGEDGDGTAHVFIGASPTMSNDPGDVLVTDVNPALFLSEEDTSVDLWARVNNPDGMRMIWAEVKAPDYDPGDPGAGVQIEMDTYKQATAECAGEFCDTFHWYYLDGGEEIPGLFDTPGTYQVFYFAKDNDTGHVSPLVQSRVYKAKADNQLPAPFLLLSPANATQNLFTTVILDWEDTIDYNYDIFTYTILLSKDDETFSDPLRIENLPHSLHLAVLPDDWDTHRVYWKVLAVDEFGAVESSQTWWFEVNKNNPPVGRWIIGCVTDSATGQGIVDALITIGAIQEKTCAGGVYYSTPTPGTYTISVQKDGYYPAAKSNIEISYTSEDSVVVNFSLTAIVSDQDNDELPDSFETLYGIDTGGDDAILDPDNDGFSNFREYLAKTSPVNRRDIPLIIADQDNDHDVDGSDLEIIIREMGKNCEAYTPCFFDYNDNGEIDGMDIRIFAEDLGRKK